MYNLDFNIETCLSCIKLFYESNAHNTNGLKEYIKKVLTHYADQTELAIYFRENDTNIDQYTEDIYNGLIKGIL